jgi:hypothetical protein
VNRRSNAAEELFDELVSRIADAVVERMKSGPALTEAPSGATREETHDARPPKKTPRFPLRPVEISEFDKARARAELRKRGM